LVQTPHDKFGAIRKGLLEFLILRIVSAQRVYAGEILTRLSSTDFAAQEGTLYPLLSRMRREELLDYEWVESQLGPPRKYYRLTPNGKAWLSELNRYWKTINSVVEEMGK
jgi:PadR family transcriptional regulator PadR